MREPSRQAMRGESTFVVVPAFNEAATLGEVVRELRAGGYRVVVVDDGSQDETARAARDAGAVTLRHPVNRGQGAALQTGLSYSLRAGARTVVTFDADGQHSSADIPALLAPILDGRCDVVLGSRFLGDPGSIPFVRRQLLRAAVLFTRLTAGLPVTDTHNGLRAFSRRAASRIHLTLDRMAHASELLDQIRAAGLSTTEVPVRVCYTRYSRAKGQGHLGAVKILADYLLNRLIR